MPPPPLVDLSRMSTPTTNAACQAKHPTGGPDGWKCFMAQYVAPYTSTPLFFAEGMYDSWQMGNVLDLGCGRPTPEKTCSTAALAAFFEYATYPAPTERAPHFPS